MGLGGRPLHLVCFVILFVIDGVAWLNSFEDFHAALQPTSYQASSIHSRRRLSSIAHSGEVTPMDSPPPPPPPTLPSSVKQQDYQLRNQRSAREDRLLSDLWLMSAATFRRLGKIEQAKGSIQEAEVRDENNPNVWVQVCAQIVIKLVAEKLIGLRLDSWDYIMSPLASTNMQLIHSRKLASSVRMMLLLQCIYLGYTSIPMLLARFTLQPMMIPLPSPHPLRLLLQTNRPPHG